MMVFSSFAFELHAALLLWNVVTFINKEKYWFFSSMICDTEIYLEINLKKNPRGLFMPKQSYMLIKETKG